MSPTGLADRRSRRLDSGFTLIEMVGAMMVVGLILALALPLHARRSGPQTLEALALQAAALIKADRRTAMAQAEPNATHIDLKRGRLQSGAHARAFAVPADVVMRARLGPSCPRNATGGDLVFAPSGSACGGLITLTTTSSAIAIVVEALTGSVEVTRHGL